jgi:hypothetical protein
MVSMMIFFIEKIVSSLVLEETYPFEHRLEGNMLIPA